MKRTITFCIAMLCYLFVTSTVNALTRVYVKLVTDTQSWTNVTVDANNIVKTIGTGGDYADFTSIDFNSTGLNLISGDEVWVAKGSYPFSKQLPSITSGISIYGGFAGTETAVYQRVKSDLDGNGMIEPWEFANTTKFVGLGNSNSTPQNFRMIILNSGKTLDGVTISDIYYSNSGTTTYAGGGEIQTGALIRNSIIQNISSISNSAGNGVSGGGIYVNRGGMDGCLVENCYADNLAANNTQSASGAGVYINGGSTTTTSDCTGYLINSVIRNCTAGSTSGAKSAAGGGVYADNGARVENCVIYNNSAFANSGLAGTSQGGGIIGQTHGDTYLKGNYFVNLTVVNNFSNGYPSFFPASNYASAYNCIVWQNGTSSTPVAPATTYSAISSIRISSTTGLTGYPYLDYIFYNTDNSTAIQNGTNNKANPFNGFTAKVILSGTDNSAYPGFFRPTTFVGSSNVAGDITNMRQANWTLSSTSPIVNNGVSAPTNTLTTTTSLQAASPYVSSGNTFSFSPSDITGATVGTQYQLGAYGRYTYKLNVVVGSNGNLFEADGVTTTKSAYPVFSNDTKTFKVVPANGYILSSATIGSTTLTPNGNGMITIPSMASDATLTLTFAINLGTGLNTLSNNYTLSVVNKSLFVKTEIASDIIIYNLSGLCVSKSVVKSTNQKFDLSGGVYIVKLISESGIFSQKVIIN